MTARLDYVKKKLSWFECENEEPTKERPSEAQGQEATDHKQWAD